MPLPLPRRSKYDKMSKEDIAKSIEEDQRDYSDLEFEKQERTLDKLMSLWCHCFNQKQSCQIKCCNPFLFLNTY